MTRASPSHEIVLIAPISGAGWRTENAPDQATTLIIRYRLGQRLAGKTAAPYRLLWGWVLVGQAIGEPVQATDPAE